jgi:hypothetical protein
VSRQARRLTVVLVLAVAAATLNATLAHAADPAKRRLARTYAPIVKLRTQTANPPCNQDQEQYTPPTSVNTVLGNPRVKLVRILNDGNPRLIARAPTAKDIAGKGHRYHLDLPGDPLTPECDYAKDFAKLRAERRAPAVTYAHFATQPGYAGFVIQYWFFYYFNQFNDLHEGDWEGMQIAFPERSARQALRGGPSEIALFQHGGGERASWSDGKVQKEGAHPVVYPAAGSHATFYDSAVYVENGKHGAGLGCDNTSGPLTTVRVQPVIIPTSPAPGSRFQWLTYEGHWGQLEKSYNNGPTGPNTKTQWLEPFSWMSGLRVSSPQLPRGLVIGPGVTGAFCGTVATLSSFVNLEAQSRTGALVLAAIALVLLLAPALLTRWRPVELSPFRQTRRFGQLVRAARQVYGQHWRPLVLIALTAIPIIGVIQGIQWLTQQLFGSVVATEVGGLGQPVGFAAVAAVVIVFMRDLEQGGSPGFVSSYRGMLPRLGRLVGGQLLATFGVIALAITVIGIPVAVYKYVGWQFVQQEIVFEDKSIREAFHGSSDQVRGHWWRTVWVAGFFWLISIVTGPVVTFALIFTPFPLIWINALGSLVFALLIPYVAIGRTLLYFDLGARERKPARRRGRLLERLPWFRAGPRAQEG